MTRLLASLLALGLLAGCGRAGPPRTPGPKDQVTYPRAYPKPDVPPIAPQLAPPETSPLAPLGAAPGAAPNTPEVPPALR